MSNQDIFSLVSEKMVQVKVKVKVGVKVKGRR